MGKATTPISAKAERQAEIDAAQKSGAAWAQMFIDKYRSNPDGYALEGWVDDAENLFKGNDEERDAFYDTLQKGLVHAKNADQVIVEDDIIDIHPSLWEAQSICKLLYGFVEAEHKNGWEIKHAADVIRRLIGKAHKKLNVLEGRCAHG